MFYVQFCFLRPCLASMHRNVCPLLLHFCLWDFERHHSLATHSQIQHPLYLHIGCCSFCLVTNLTVCDPMDCSPPGSSLSRGFQARILGWVAIPFSRGSSWPRDWTHIPCIGRWILYYWATWEAPFTYSIYQQLSFSFILLRVCPQQYHLTSWIVFHPRLLINRY